MQPCQPFAQVKVDTDSLPALVPLALVMAILDQFQAAHLQDTDAGTKCSQKQAAEADWIDGSP